VNTANPSNSPLGVVRGFRSSRRLHPGATDSALPPLQEERWPPEDMLMVF